MWRMIGLVSVSEERSQRVRAVLPAKLMAALERWARSLGEKPATLASYILRVEINKAIADGRVPPIPEEEGGGWMGPIVAKLIDGEKLSAEEEEALAEGCDRDPLDVNAASRKLRKNGNGQGSISKVD